MSSIFKLIAKGSKTIVNGLISTVRSVSAAIADTDQVRKHPCTCAYTCVHTRIHINICIYINLYIFTHIHRYIHTDTYSDTYPHTYTHT